MAETVWAERAAERPVAVADCLEQFDPIAANRIGGRLLAFGESLSAFPDRGRPAGDGEREPATVPPHILRYAVRAEVDAIPDIHRGARLPRAG